MKVDIFVHLSDAYHGLTQSHFVLFWNKSLHGLEPIFFIVPHGRIYVLSYKAPTYIFDVKSPYALMVKLE